MHYVEAFLSQHPWWTLLLGAALPFVAVIVLGIAFGQTTDEARDEATAEGLDPTLLAIQHMLEGARLREDHGRDIRGGREWWEIRLRLDKLARQVDSCAKQVGELQALVVKRTLTRDQDSDPGAPGSPDEGGDSGDEPRGGAGADGPDAVMLFPKSATSSMLSQRRP